MVDLTVHDALPDCLQSRALFSLPRAAMQAARQSCVCAALALLLAGLVLLPPLLVAASPPPAPFTAAVLPFADRRHPGQPSWLGDFLRDRIAKALLREPRVALLPQESATLWTRVLDLQAGSGPSAIHLERMGVAVVLSGTTQEVLGLADVHLSARTASGELLEGESGRIRAHLGDTPPDALMKQVLDALQSVLLPDVPLTDNAMSSDWASVQTFYTLLAEPIVPGDRAVRPSLASRLQPWIQDSALGPRAHEALAQLLLEQAVLYLPDGAGQRLMLAEALQHATQALRADPRDTSRQALKAELHYFLKQDYEAKTEASVARMRNPSESLAFVVLGLVAGLSTGEATEQLNRAISIDPFLRTAARPQGVPPYQGGLLEPFFSTWDELKTRRGLTGPNDQSQLIADAIAHFERREWDEAEPLFREAAQREENDVTPWIYLNRILIELGHPEEAIPGLRRLAAGNPQNAEVHHFLGLALELSGEPEAAQTSYRKALAEDPDDTRSLYRLATSDMALERWSDALSGLRSLLHREPDHPEAWLQLGVVQTHLQDWPGAQAALERALELDPESGEARRRLTDIRQRHTGVPSAQ